MGRIVLSTSAESSTVVVHSSSLSYIAATARRVVGRWCSSIYRPHGSAHIYSQLARLHTHKHIHTHTTTNVVVKSFGQLSLSILYIPTLDVTNRHPFIYSTQHNMCIYVYTCRENISSTTRAVWVFFLLSFFFLSLTGSKAKSSLIACLSNCCCQHKTLCRFGNGRRKKKHTRGWWWWYTIYL